MPADEIHGTRRSAGLPCQRGAPCGVLPPDNKSTAQAARFTPAPTGGPLRRETLSQYGTDAIPQARRRFDFPHVVEQRSDQQIRIGVSLRF